MAVARQPTGTDELDQALSAIADRAAGLAEADVVVVRLADDRGGLVAHAVHSVSESVRAELESSRIELDALSAEEDPEPGALAAPLRVAAERLSAVGVLQLPVRENGDVVGSVELMRRRSAFDERQRELARAIADEVALARRAYSFAGAARLAPDPLELAGDALAAAADETQAAEQVAVLAAEATGAHATLLWRYDGDEEVLAASAGSGAAEAAGRAAPVARRARVSREPVTVERLDSGAIATLQLGEPALGALQLVLAEEPEGSDPVLQRLATFAVRAAHMLRVAEQRRLVADELERSRALLTIVGQAISELSLAHTLDTAVARVCELLSADRLAVYLLGKDDGRLETAAECGLTGPHVRVGERLLELALGPGRGRGLVLISDASDGRLGGVRGAIEELGIESLLGVPLRSGEELIGLLAAYLERGRTLTASEESLLLALASQLAVAVQNARLHEDVERESEEAKRARDEAQAVSKRLQALYDISRSFTESLSLKRTLEAIVESSAEALNVDAAVLRTPNERGDALVAVAVHVREGRLSEPIAQVLSLPQPITPARPRRSGEPLLLDAAAARALGQAHEPLIPFLEKGSSAAVIPLESPREEVLGTLTLLSLDAEHPITQASLEAALSIVGPAALALDNARLHQERQEFTETMQRSLLPQSRPELPGLDVGHVYAPATRVEVGGDVYDFLELPDGRLAVVLGDVSGHGIEAAADMAMAKFVFRSLVRDHPEPGELLAAANEVVLGEVGVGRFVTMLCLTIDPRSGELACACAGHPPPRILTPRGVPEQVRVSGLALGVESGQSYDVTTLQLEPGAAAVLFTDGLLEARRDGELYGEQRLDAALARHAGLTAPELARAIVEDCHAFAGELGDDLAVVVLKRV